MSQSTIEALGLISLETALSDQAKVIEFLKNSQLNSQDSAVSGSFLNDVLLLVKALLSQEKTELAALVKGIRFGYIRKISDSEEAPAPYRVESCFIEDSDWQINVESSRLDMAESLLNADDKEFFDGLSDWLFDGLAFLYPGLSDCLGLQVELQFKLRFSVKDGGELMHPIEGSGAESILEAASERSEVLIRRNCQCDQGGGVMIGGFLPDSNGVCNQQC